MGNGLRMVLAGVVVLAAWQVANAQSWGTAQLLNMPSETGQQVKSAKIVGARSGGFHAIYNVGKIRYRRYQNGVLNPAVDVFPGSNFHAGGNIAEARNGHIHVVFENWIDGPYVGWHRSTNGGASFSSVQNISPDGHCKHPQIAPFGTGNSGSATTLRTVLRSCPLSRAMSLTDHPIRYSSLIMCRLSTFSMGGSLQHSG